jgi:fatty-acyl-CoA synthase
VGLIADTEPDFVRAFFACQYAGLVPAPLPLPAPLGGREAYVEQIARMLGSAHAKLLIGPNGMKDWVAEIAAKAPLSFAGALADLPESGSDALPEVRPDNTCYLQFSSGSTRFPTGVLVTHRALMANAVAITRDGLKVQPSDRLVAAALSRHGPDRLPAGADDQPDDGRPAAHRRLRAPAAAVAGPDHQEWRHHLLQPDLRL